MTRLIAVLTATVIALCAAAVALADGPGGLPTQGGLTLPSGEQQRSVTKVVDDMIAERRAEGRPDLTLRHIVAAVMHEYDTNPSQERRKYLAPLVRMEVMLLMNERALAAPQHTPLQAPTVYEIAKLTTFVIASYPADWRTKYPERAKAHDDLNTFLDNVPPETNTPRRGDWLRAIRVKVSETYNPPTTTSDDADVGIIPGFNPQGD